MNNYLITIDSSCDCSLQELNQKNIPVIFFKYNDETKTYKDNMQESGYKNFYNQMKEGKVFKTSQINPEEYYQFFEHLLDKNIPIIHISLGSGVSNTINSANLAISQLKEKYPNSDIRVIDTKLASLGSVLIMNKLIEFNSLDYSVDKAMNEIMPYVESLNAYYTTNTLTYFARGGRLSKIEAFFGNALKINPILDCDPDGKLRVIEKARGSKKAIERLIARIKDSSLDVSNQTVLVCHADNEQTATSVGERLVQEVGFKDYKLYFMGPIIGAHTGPGLIACFFFGKKRKAVITSLTENKEELEKQLEKNTLE